MSNQQRFAFKKSELQNLMELPGEYVLVTSELVLVPYDSALIAANIVYSESLDANGATHGKGKGCPWPCPSGRPIAECGSQVEGLLAFNSENHQNSNE